MSSLYRQEKDWRDPDLQERRKPLYERTWVRLVGALITGAVIWLTAPPVQKAVCDSWFVFGRAPSSVLCDPQLQEVPPSEAALTADMFIGRAGAASPTQAWEMLTKDAQSVQSKEDFAKDWDGVLWAERTSELEPIDGQNNQWLLRYRTYGGSSNEVDEGNVDDRQMRITLVHGPVVDDNRVAASATTQRTAGDRFSYPRVIVRVKTKTYNLPTTSARVAAPQVKSGGGLRVMCQTTVQDGATWLRTPLGWIDSVNLRGGGFEASGAPACAPQHAAAVSRCDAQVPPDPRCARYVPGGKGQL